MQEASAARVDTCKCGHCQGSVVPVLTTKPMTECRWQSTHWDFMKSHGLKPKEVAELACSLKSPFLTTPRERHLVAIWMKRGEHKDINVLNVSQTVQRCSPMSSCMPCITTSGKYYLMRRERLVTTEELMIMQGFPMSQIDRGVSSRQELKIIAGNAMQVHSCAAALLTLFCLVDRAAFTKQVKKLNANKGIKRKAI